MLCKIKKTVKSLIISYLRFAYVIPKRFERLTHALEGRCSIQLSYGTSLNCECKITINSPKCKDYTMFFYKKSDN